MPAIVTQQGQKSSALDLSEAAIGPDQGRQSAVDHKALYRPPPPADDTTKASPDGAFAQLSSPRAAPSISLPHQDANYVTHIALDIGGSLIKLVCCARVCTSSHHQPPTGLLFTRQPCRKRQPQSAAPRRCAGNAAPVHTPSKPTLPQASCILSSLRRPRWTHASISSKPRGCIAIAKTANKMAS